MQRNQPHSLLDDVWAVAFAVPFVVVPTYLVAPRFLEEWTYLSRGSVRSP